MATTVKDARKALGWSQADLAARAGISEPYVSYLENGLRPPRSGVCAAVAEALDVPVSELFPESR